VTSPSSRGSRGARVLAAAALLSLTTACGPVALGGGTVSSAPDGADQVALRAPASTTAPTTTPPVAPSATPTPVPTVPVVPSTPASEAQAQATTATDSTAAAGTARAGSTTVGNSGAGSTAGGSTTGDTGNELAAANRSTTSTAPTRAASSAAASSSTAPARSAVTATGALTNRTSSYSAAGHTADYRVFAEGIDTARPVGLLVYIDGTGEYGVENPTSSYAIGGSAGLAAVARAHNMVLVAPFSPNRSCECWEQGDAAGYAKYLASLIGAVQAQYSADDLWVAGYSSGSQAATRFLFPVHPGLWARGGGVIAIGGGGAPASRSTSIPASIRDAVVMRWDTGALDTGSGGGFNALSGPYGAQAGERWYAGQGFDTAIVVPAGVGHARNGQFGRIVDGFIG
jgi:hypothetical protein